MRSKLLFCLSVLVALLGAAQASKHAKVHPWKLGHKQELLQTHSKATVTTEAVAANEATAESEAECDPECVYKFPYLDGKCTIKDPIPPPGEIFVTDFADCFDFDLTVVPPPKEEEETFVLTWEGCYNLTTTPTLPPVTTETTESTDTETEPEPVPTPTPPEEKVCVNETKITVYRYPFIDPDGNCTVDERKPGTIEVVNSPTPLNRTIKVVDENGRTKVSKIDEHGEYHPVPPDVPQPPIITGDEESEVILDDKDEGEGKEEFILLFDVCYTYEKDADTGETIFENREDITTGESNEEVILRTNEKNIILDQEEEVILIPFEKPPTVKPPTNTTEPPTEPPTTNTTETTETTDDECIIYDNYTTGTTVIYGQPVTYITKNTYNNNYHHSVSYTYVLTNVYSGIFKTSEYNYVIYGAGAVNFYNNYYHIDARVHDTPSCSCTCGYQTYTFSYSFGF